MNRNRFRHAYSLVELVAVAVLLGVLASIIIRRVHSYNDEAEVAACDTNQGDIEIQAELWLHNSGSWPASDLSDMGADINYFPDGLPSCPVDGSSYALDPATGLVIGHNH